MCDIMNKVRYIAYYLAVLYNKMYMAQIYNYNI